MAGAEDQRRRSERATPTPGLHRHVSVGMLIAVLLIGLDSSQQAGAVISEHPRTALPQLISPMAVVEKSGLTFDRLVTPEDPAVPMSIDLNVESGDTLIALLARVGVVMSDAYAAVRSLRGVFSVRDVRPGLSLRVTLEPQAPPRLAALQSVEFQPSVEREIRIRRNNDADGEFLATTIPHPLHRVGSVASGTIDNGLFNAAMAAGVPHDLLVEAIALFSFEVDFQRDLRAGDQFELFYDTLNNDKGDVAKAGELYFAKLVLSGKEMRYYRFKPRSGASDLFSPDGHSIRKALLQTPVDAMRISSSFGMRLHPVLGYTMMHRGVDFAAPSGTPVRAAGDGRVVVAGNGGSYGNYVRIQHNSNYSTAYAHLKSFASGVKNGARVRQGEVIAYVGATGRATGPHLHYEVLLGGKQVNPRGVRLPAGETLTGDDLRIFKQRLQEVDAMREAQRAGRGVTVAQVQTATCDAGVQKVGYFPNPANPGC